MFRVELRLELRIDFWYPIKHFDRIGSPFEGTYNFTHSGAEQASMPELPVSKPNHIPERKHTRQFH